MADDLFVLKKCKDPEKLYHIEPGEWSKGATSVIICCPQCGAKGPLDHEIADDGKVTPSIQCYDCSWHVFARLEGWADA